LLTFVGACNRKIDTGRPGWEEEVGADGEEVLNLTKEPKIVDDERPHVFSKQFEGCSFETLENGRPYGLYCGAKVRVSFYIIELGKPRNHAELSEDRDEDAYISEYAREKGDDADGVRLRSGLASVGSGGMSDSLVMWGNDGGGRDVPLGTFVNVICDIRGNVVVRRIGDGCNIRAAAPARCVELLEVLIL
jgi:hypothetical protein